MATFTQLALDLYDGDKNAQALFSAARDNDARSCTLSFNSRSCPEQVNALAVLIAAENKSYDAFESMLDIAATSKQPMARILKDTFNISKQDARLSAALTRHSDATHDNLMSMLKEAHALTLGPAKASF